MSNNNNNAIMNVFMQPRAEIKFAWALPRQRKDRLKTKRLMILLVFCGMLMSAMADWTYGTARFKGSQPSSSMTHGTVRIWYNGSLTQKGTEGEVEIWERLRVGELSSGMGTGDICVVYPKNYNGPKMRFTSTGGTVQTQTLQ